MRASTQKNLEFWGTMTVFNNSTTLSNLSISIGLFTWMSNAYSKSLSSYLRAKTPLLTSILSELKSSASAYNVPLKEN